MQVSKFNNAHRPNPPSLQKISTPAPSTHCFTMTRGNQRDRDRERAQARGTAKGKGKDDGLTPEQRRERDGKALQEKAAKKAAEGAGSGNSEGKSTKK
ncbi:small EDRK-rich factor 2-like [Camellia sinensis]|uniref:small EDRK-rich factor 2-like n=1 Tax=Camellia sinensis TaxID=4442 RepID=UPI0010361CFA|nr:small EDRK-rich factor 2-like [Camellia sinensis]